MFAIWLITIELSVASVLLIEKSGIFDHLPLDHKVVWFEKYAEVIKNTSSVHAKNIHVQFFVCHNKS